MALPLKPRDITLLLSALGEPETRDRVVALLDLAGTGNMTGPTSATDNTLVRFDGTTGALVQDSSVVIGDETSENVLISRLATNDSLQITGGNSSVNGGSVILYGGSHATKSNTIEFNLGATNVFTINNDLQLLGSSNNATTPTYSFGADPDTGFYRIGAGSAGFSSNGSNIAQYASNGGWIFGGSTLTVTHAFNGNLKLDAGSNTVAIFRNHQNDAGISLNGGTTGANSGGNIIAYGPTHATKANLLEFYSGTTLQGSKDANGAWILGASGSTQSHTINGNGFSLVRATATDAFDLFRGSNTGSLRLLGGGGGLGGNLQLFGETHATLASHTQFYNNNAVTGEIDENGKWTIGVSGGSQSHVIFGDALKFGTSNGTNDFVFNDGTGSTASIRILGGANAASADIQLYGSAHATKASITEFKNNNVLSGSISSSQAWTLGASGGSSSHTINGFLTVQGTGTGQFIIKDTASHATTGAPRMAFTAASSTLAQLGFEDPISETFTFRGVGSVSNFRWIVANTITAGSINQDGKWIIGASGGTQSHEVNGNLSTTGQLSGKGTSTNDNAASGYIGEYTESLVTSFTNFPGATGEYGDGTSLALTAGDWDVTAVAEFRDNGATIAGVSEMGIGTASGNSATGLVGGSNAVGIGYPSGANTWWGGAVPSYRVSINSTTTYYLKLFATYSAGNPQYRCRLSARRVR